MKFELKPTESLVDLIKAGKVPEEHIEDFFIWIMDNTHSIPNDDRGMDEQMGVNSRDLGYLIHFATDVTSYFLKFLPENKVAGNNENTHNR